MCTCSMVVYAHAKNITGKFEFSLTFARLTFPNIDAWAIEGICKPLYYSNACKERTSKASSLLVIIIIIAAHMVLLLFRGQETSIL